jgi:iron complex outermembrane receptor protein
MNSIRIASMASAAALLCGGQLAQASPAATPAAATTLPADATTGDIIVTAQRRDQRLAEVPISITAIGARTLAASGVNSTIALTRVTPGLLAVDQGFNFVAAIRGISSSGNVAGDESNVALYVDGVYVATPTAGLFSFNNIERVEVLKGPQGTLFGRNATGGAIRVITRRPTQQTTFDASAEFSPSYNGKRAQAYLSGGVTRNVAADLAVYYYSDTGFITNINPT